MGDNIPVRETFFSKKFSADHNTSKDTLEQIALYEWYIEQAFLKIYNDGLSASDLNDIEYLYRLLVEVYGDRLNAMMYSAVQGKAKPREEKVNELYKQIFDSGKNTVSIGLIKEFMKELREYKRWLYEVKQKNIKMGIPTKAEMTQKEAIKKAMTG